MFVGLIFICTHEFIIFFVTTLFTCVWRVKRFWHPSQLKLLIVLLVFWLKTVCTFFHVLPDIAHFKATYNKYMIVIHPRTYVRKAHELMFHGMGSHFHLSFWQNQSSMLAIWLVSVVICF